MVATIKNEISPGRFGSLRILLLDHKRLIDKYDLSAEDFYIFYVSEPFYRWILKGSPIENREELLKKKSLIGDEGPFMGIGMICADQEEDLRIVLRANLEG